MKYLRKFENNAAYESATLDLPNVAYCEEENEVHYNPIHDYSQDYLTFEVVESGTITIVAGVSGGGYFNTIFYKVNDGEWYSLTTSTEEQELGGTLSVGDKVFVKGTNSYYAVRPMSTPMGTLYFYTQFGGTAKTNVSGNIMSLVYGDNFINNNTLSDEYTFSRLFYQYTNLLSAENLILPTMALTTACYQGMFQGCTSLTTAPELPAITLAYNCYQSMFEFCTNINYIKAMFTTTPSETYTENWVSGVAATGTFVKNSAAQWNVSGNNGIPTDWTVETASK